MLPGGVRRIIVPSEYAYADLARPNKNTLQVQDCSTGAGPIPPNTPQSSGDMGAGEFQRFKNICERDREFHTLAPCARAASLTARPVRLLCPDCNANRPYQPDLVLDIKLFGKRTVD